MPTCDPQKSRPQKVWYSNRFINSSLLDYLTSSVTCRHTSFQNCNNWYRKCVSQSCDFARNVYVRCPKGWTLSQRVVWKLLKPAYGLVNSSRSWQLSVNNWVHSQQIYKAHGLSHLFVKRDDYGLILLEMVKVVDVFLVIGHCSKIAFFHHSNLRRLAIGRFVHGNECILNRLFISRDYNGSIQNDMQEYFSTILLTEMTILRKKEQRKQCTEEEVRSYQHLAGALNLFGHSVLPQASFATSYLKQKIPRLWVAQLVTAKKILKELVTLEPIFTFLSPSSASEPSYLCFADASVGTSSYS